MSRNHTQPLISLTAIYFVDLIDQVSDTRSQGCTGLQRLVCLDHGDFAVQYAVMQDCVRLHDALKCLKMLSEAIFTVMASRAADRKLPRDIRCICC
jgi:hypothetical protein